MPPAIATTVRAMVVTPSAFRTLGAQEILVDDVPLEAFLVAR